MNPDQLIGYYDGYQDKTAGWGALGTVAGAGAGGLKLTAETAGALLPWLLVAPALVGAGGGLLHSKLESPTDLDQQGVQQSLEVAELEEYATELRRRQEEAAAEEERSNDRKRSPGERTLHI